MTIWQIILGWIISDVIAWVLWWRTIKHVIEKKAGFKQAVILNERLGNYPATQNRVIEWIRLIVWPYGITQRTILFTKELKSVLSE